MSFTLNYDIVNNVPVIVGTAAAANGGINISIAIDYTRQANLIADAATNIAANVASINANVNTIRVAMQNLDANLSTIRVVGTTNTPISSNGFITRSKFEDYDNILFLRYLMDPNTQFGPFPSPPSPQEQQALDSIPSWVNVANNYLPPRG
jgi:hypothetical protein